MDTKPMTTDEVLKKLAASGLQVTRNMLAQDVRDGYLPPPTMVPRGDRRGIGRLWSVTAYRRTIYLYRLRRRGVTGELLRVLLFMKDGWGWERVKPICLKGYQKLVRWEQSDVKKVYRKPQKGDVEDIVPAIAKEHGFKEKTVRYTLGMSFFGEPLEGGSLAGLYQAVEDTFGDYGFPWPVELPAELCRSLQTVFSELLSHCGLSWKAVLSEVESANDEFANIARSELVGFWHRLRRATNRYHREHHLPIQSSNIMTLGGRSHKGISDFLWNLPGRPTSAQLLGAHLAIMIPEVVIVEGLKLNLAQGAQLLASYTQNQEAVSKFHQVVNWFFGNGTELPSGVTQADIQSVQGAMKRYLRANPGVVKEIESNPLLKQLTIEALDLK